MRCLASAAVLFLLAAPPVGARDFFRSLELRLSGGFLDVHGGDFSTYHTDTQLYYDELLRPFAFERTGALRALGSAREIELEAVLHISRRLAVGFGVGYLETGDTGSVTWRHAEHGDMQLDGLLAVNAIPLRLTGYVTPLRTSFVNGYLFGGGGIYLLDSDSRYEVDSRIVGSEMLLKEDYESSGTGFGLHAGLGLEIKLGASLRVFVEATARRATVGNLEGNSSYYIRPSTGGAGSGEVWYFESYSDEVARWLSGVRYGDRPEGEALRDVRRLRVDLSGIGLRIGFRLGLGSWD